MTEQVFMVFTTETNQTMRCRGVYSDSQEAEQVAALSFGFVVEVCRPGHFPVVKKAEWRPSGEKSVSTLVVDDVEVE